MNESTSSSRSLPRAAKAAALARLAASSRHLGALPAGTHGSAGALTQPLVRRRRLALERLPQRGQLIRELRVLDAQLPPLLRLEVKPASAAPD
jgi:hypothetical protein